MTEPTTNSDHTVNAAQHAYEGVKSVWIWGKGIPLLGLAEGMAETIAKQFISLAGTSLEDIDAHVKPHLSGLDQSVLNPAISKVVNFVMAGIGKGDDTLRPIFMKIAPPILGPLGLMKNEESETTTKTASAQEKQKEPMSSIVAPEITTISSH